MRTPLLILSSVVSLFSFAALAEEAAPAVQPDPAPLTIQWKFAEGRQHLYAYEKFSYDMNEKTGGIPPAATEPDKGDKEKKKESKPGVPSEKNETQMELTGTLAVVMDAETARMRPDQSVKSMKKDGKKAGEEDIKTANQYQKDQMSALEIAFLPDGLIKGDPASDAGNLQLTLHAHLPVPPKPLAVAQPLEEDVIYNFKELQPMRGKAKWELKSIEDKEGRRLASYHLGLNLKMDEDATKLHIVYGRPSMTMTVESDVVFDLDAGRIESVDSVMKSSLHRKYKERRDADDPGLDAVRRMNNEQKIKLTFKSEGAIPKPEEAKPATTEPAKEEAPKK